MFNLILIIFFFLTGIGLRTSSEETIYIIGTVLAAITLVWFVIFLISSFCLYSYQERRYENLFANIRRINIYKKRRTDILEDIRAYLSEKYPEIEEKIFKSLSTDKANFKVILNMPEIKSSETLIELTKQIKGIGDDIYQWMRSVECDCADIRYNLRSKWQLFKPQLPQELKEFVYSNLKE